MTNLRLPTEAEWEYAYRAGTRTAYHGSVGTPEGTNGIPAAFDIGWFLSATSGSQTMPVGGKLANGFGVHDMSGNAWEWVSDWYGQGYYSDSPSNDPQGPTSGSQRILRGGGSGGSATLGRASYRKETTPSDAAGHGLRVARNP